MHYDIYEDEGREESPLTVCDRDCAGANNCRVGGYQCPDCGKFFCPVSEESDDGGRCADCSARHMEEMREEAEAEADEEVEDGK